MAKLCRPTNETVPPASYFAPRRPEIGLSAGGIFPHMAGAALFRATV